MKCQIQFPGKSEKTISKCYLLKIDVQHFLGNFTRQHIDDMFIFSRKQFDIRRQFA